jgi:flavin-dependent dehydrogenase
MGNAQRPEYDVLVVGGGPAGSSAALSLARRGGRVLLCEAKAHPHDKLCGEFLSPECIPLLEALGVGPALRALGPAPIDRARLSVPSGLAWETRLPGTAWGLTRRGLDAALLDQAVIAGVVVWRGAAVVAIKGSLTAGFQATVAADRGRREIRVRAVLVAHGKRGALDRSLGRRFLDQPQPFVALKRHFRGPVTPGRIELHSFPGGYCGFSAIEHAAHGGAATGAANLCLLAHAGAWARARREMPAAHPDRAQAFVDWMRRQHPRLDDWLGRATPLGERWISIAQVPFGPKPAVEGDVLLAGDAAGLIAPLAGDGIAMALRGGALAAEHLSAFLEGTGQPADLRVAYPRAWRREFGARLRLARLSQVFLLRPALFGLALRLLNASPALGRYFVTHTRDVPRLAEKRGG